MSNALALLLLSVPALAADPRCAGTPKERAARFSATSLSGRSEGERYLAFVEACALDEVVALTQRLVAFETVSADQPADKSPAFAAQASFLEQWARQHGLRFHSEPGNAAHALSFGEGARRLGFVTHGDVVPAPPAEWKRAPFTAVVEGGRLYGRGVEDDKGPLAAGLVAMQLAHELGLRPRGEVVMMVGNGEEHDWSGMKAYAEKTPHPAHVVSLDASYPVVVAQSGFVGWELEADVGSLEAAGGRAVAVDVSAGEFLTQVPGTARLTLTGGEDLERKVRAVIAQVAKRRPSLRAELQAEADRWVLVTHGTAVHSSTAEDGHNALWDLAALAVRLPLTRNGITAMLEAVARRFDGDHYGEKLKLAYADPLMGKLLVAATLLRVKDGKVTLGVNMRRPKGLDAEAFRQRLSKAAARLHQESFGRLREAEAAYIGDPHVADTQGPLVQTLLDIYRRRRQAPQAASLSVRGGTYARLFPGAVDFGPGFPGEPYAGHAPDESISLENLRATTEMTAEVLLRLAVD